MRSQSKWPLILNHQLTCGWLFLTWEYISIFDLTLWGHKLHLMPWKSSSLGMIFGWFSLAGQMALGSTDGATLHMSSFTASVMASLKVKILNMEHFLVHQMIPTYHSIDRSVSNTAGLFFVRFSAIKTNLSWQNHEFF